jgi:hypothetical protein
MVAGMQRRQQEERCEPPVTARVCGGAMRSIDDRSIDSLADWICLQKVPQRLFF